MMSEDAAAIRLASTSRSRCGTSKKSATRISFGRIRCEIHCCEEFWARREFGAGVWGQEFGAGVWGQEFGARRNNRRSPTTQLSIPAPLTWPNSRLSGLMTRRALLPSHRRCGTGRCEEIDQKCRSRNYFRWMFLPRLESWTRRSHSPA
jgi:hypothetical protein